MKYIYGMLLATLVALTPYSLNAQSLTLIVDATNDDSAARDANPGDGICSDQNGRCTLRAAIDEANASSGLDVTVVIPGLLPGSVSGKFTLSRVAPNVAFNTYENDNAYGDLDVNGSFASLTLQGTGTPGPTLSISPNDRILDIVSGGPVTVERIQFTGGTARPGRNGNPDGSGSFGVDGEDGEDGGGMRVGPDMVVDMDQVTFNGNFTQSGGNGAAPASSIARIDGGNGGNGGNGGAIYVSAGADVTITRGTFTQNGTGDGGSPASGQSNGEPAAGGRGGSGGNGGGIYSAGSLSLISCTIAFNECGDPTSGAAGVNGGERGVQGEGGSGGGVALAEQDGGEAVTEGTCTLENTIVAGNRAGDDPNDGTQPGTDFYDNKGGKRYTSRGYNLIGTKNASGAFRKRTGDRIGNGKTGIDPQLNGLNGNADAAVPTMEPRSGSPALNTGTTTQSNDFDARGFLRPAGGQADKGAHERNSSPFPTPLEIIDFAVAGSDEEFITIQNTGNYPIQADDHVLVAFPDDYDDAGPSCLSINLYGEIQPGETFTVADPAISPKRHTIGFDTRGPSCEDGADNQLSDVRGALGLYTGGATSIQGFVIGNYAAARKDLVEYDFSAALERSGFNTALSADTGFEVFPNPSNGQLTVAVTSGLEGKLDYSVSSITGTVLRSGIMEHAGGGQQIVRLNLSDLPKGAYFVRLTGLGDDLVKRVMLR